MKIEFRRLRWLLLGGIGTILFLQVWMMVARHFFPTNPDFVSADMYLGVPVESNPWLEPWQRWDTMHYQAIATRGYDAFGTALFTPPLFPWLMRGVALLVGGNTLAAGLLVAGAAFLACLVAFYQLARFELGTENQAGWAVVFLVSYPTAFFLVAAYSESLFLLGGILALYHTRRRNWVQAGLWAAVASLARVPGAFLFIPLGVAAWQAWRAGEKRAVLAPLLAGLGAGAYPLFVWLGLGRSPFDILAALNTRGGSLSVPGWNLVSAIVRIHRGEVVAENVVESFFSLLLIFLLILVWKKLPLIYGVYSTVLVVFFLSRFGVPQPLIGMARYSLEVFPVFLLPAMLIKKASWRKVVLTLSWIGLLFFSADFAIWGWVG